jgi:hypothetical protein
MAPSRFDMKALVAALIFASLAETQSRHDIPNCARPCVIDSVTKLTSCNTEDYICICKSLRIIEGAANHCVLKQCGPDVWLSNGFSPFKFDRVLMNVNYRGVSSCFEEALHT